jgi:DNA polymerase V
MNLEFFSVDQSKKLALPLFGYRISAGFPSPADDFVEIQLDLNRHLVRNPSATFYAHVKGNSMTGARIYDGDILVIDRSLEPEHGKTAVCAVNGDFTAKLIEKKNDGLYLMPANHEYAPIKITEEINFEIWGIVTYVIHKT